jgi:MFS family permease
MSATSALTGPEFLTWGWRVPFLASIVLVGVGLWVRLRVLESPVFAQAKADNQVHKTPVVVVLREQWRDVLVAAFVRLSEQAPFYLFITFVLDYATRQLGLARGQVLNYTMLAAAVGLVSIPLFGHLSDKIGRRRMYGIGIVCVGLFAFPYYALLDTKVGGLVLLAIVLSLIFHDMQYGPQAALIAETFGTNVRYSGAGLRTRRGGRGASGGPTPRSPYPRWPASSQRKSTCSPAAGVRPCGGIRASVGMSTPPSRYPRTPSAHSRGEPIRKSSRMTRSGTTSTAVRRSPAAHAASRSVSWSPRPSQRWNSV